MSTHNTEGIVLQKINYSETSLIIKCLTINEGVKSFIFQGAKRKNKKGNIIMPLAIINIGYFQRNDSALAKISEVELAVINNNIQSNPIKSTILFFINELLLKSIKEIEFNPDLYNYVKSSIEILEQQKNISLFPIKFMINLLKYLGYYPTVQENAQYFDYLNGQITKNKPNHPNYLDSAICKYLLEIMQENLTEDKLTIPSQHKKELLETLINYYKINFDDIKSFKSLDVLEAVLY
jgi:DNA repair protein RecO (recombination protein O)